MIRPMLLALATLLSGCLHFHNGPMPGEPKDATYLELEGTRVRYVDVGEGPAVVLLHGFASSIENWLTVMPKLVKDHRIIAIDMRGFGWTDRPVADYSPAAQAKLLKAVLDERKVGKIALGCRNHVCKFDNLTVDGQVGVRPTPRGN